jgi:hypothetical protein
MTATPLAMLQHRHGLAEAASVIQLHVLGMFLPSFFNGALISRFGTLNVMVAGIAVLALHVLTTLTGTGFGSFAGALLLVLLPWLAAAFVAILALGFLGRVSARIKA